MRREQLARLLQKPIRGPRPVRLDRPDQRGNIADDVAGMQIPRLDDNGLASIGGSVDVAKLKLRRCLNSHPLGTRAAVAVQAERDGSLRKLFGLARLPEIPVGPRGVAEVAALVEVEPVGSKDTRPRRRRGFASWCA